MIEPLAIGAALMVMIFAGGYITGADYNPAVPLGVLIRGSLNVADVVPSCRDALYDQGPIVA